MTSRRSAEDKPHEVTRSVTLPSGQEATVRLRYEVLEPLQVNGTYAHVSIDSRSVRDGMHGLSGPGHDLAAALDAALELLRGHC